MVRLSYHLVDTREVSMDIATMQEKLIAVLTSMHVDSGQECLPLTSRTKPVGDLPRFQQPEMARRHDTLVH